ncbi:ATP-dependent DNA helicase [Dentipellis sp. KUC8613]|nr:ATP-dependent DNA helicase [Dentipellis sp. KUC8613]
MCLSQAKMDHDYDDTAGPSSPSSRGWVGRKEPSATVNCHSVLTDVFGYSEYKGKQKEIFEAAVLGADVFVVAPTGMGKSLCFQVPAIADDHGISIVVSPLLALMKNQVARLRESHVQVASLSSETPPFEKEEILEDLSIGSPVNRLLYITPEKLCTSNFMKILTQLHQRGELNRLVVDEAHCISEWGHDFRAEYRQLGRFRQKFPDIPIMALTASATALVQDDIVKSLRMSSQHLFKVVHPFNRPNLYYEIRYHAWTSPDSQMEDIFNYINGLHRRRNRPSSGIIYCRTRATCDELSAYLRRRGLSSRPYHRGIKSNVLDKTLREWEQGGNGDGGVDVVCATIAFGMGIDKSDVRYIIHFDLPKSFEGYYQETGRAGRDGSASKCVLYYSREDAIRVRKLVSLGYNRRQISAESTNEPPPSQRSVDSLTTLLNFAESVDVCRHVSVCRYFGENINAKDAEAVKSYCNQMCDVCKYPEKVRKRKQDLTSHDIIGTQMAKLQHETVDDEDGYAVPQVRAHHPGRAQENGAAGPSNFGRAPSRKPPAQKEYMKTPLAPMPVFAARSSYVGPALLRTRAQGLKRTGSSSSTGSEGAKRPKVDYSVPSGPVTKRPQQGMAPFKVPFKVPLKAKVSVEDVTVKPLPAADEDFDQHDVPAPPPIQDITNLEDEDNDVEEEAPFSSPAKLPDNIVQLDVSFSQKIPVHLREEAFTSIRKALHKAVIQRDGVEDIWKKVKMSSSSEIARNNIVSSVAQQLEFSVHSMSSTADGYSIRAQATVAAVKMLPNFRVWDDDSAMGDDFDDAREVVGVFRRLCKSSRSHGKSRAD